jgi:hypothetical protein
VVSILCYLGATAVAVNATNKLVVATTVLVASVVSSLASLKINEGW